MFGLDTISKAVANPENILPSLTEAFGQAWNAKWGEKLSVFFSKFSEEMDKLGKEKEEISKEAQAAASKTVEQATVDATAAVKLDTSKVEKADADVYNEALVSGVAAMKSLSPEQQAFAGKGLDKLKKAAKEGGTDRLDLDEFKAVAATGLSTLKALKMKFPDKEKLVAALAQISKASESSAYPIVGLLKTSVLKVLKPDTNPDGYVEGAKMKLRMAAIASDFGVSPMDLLSFKNDMALIKEPELTLENKTKVVTAYRKYIIPNTNESDATKVVDFVHDMIQKKPEELTVDQLADIVSLVDAQDLDRIIGIFTGKTENPKVA